MREATVRQLGLMISVPPLSVLFGLGLILGKLGSILVDFQLIFANLWHVGTFLFDILQWISENLSNFIKHWSNSDLFGKFGDNFREIFHFTDNFFGIWAYLYFFEKSWDLPNVGKYSPRTRALLKPAFTHSLIKRGIHRFFSCFSYCFVYFVFSRHWL